MSQSSYRDRFCSYRAANRLSQNSLFAQPKCKIRFSKWAWHTHTQIFLPDNFCFAKCLIEINPCQVKKKKKKKKKTVQMYTWWRDTRKTCSENEQHHINKVLKFISIVIYCVWIYLQYVYLELKTPDLYWLQNLSEENCDVNSFAIHHPKLCQGLLTSTVTSPASTHLHQLMSLKSSLRWRTSR